MFSCYCWFKDWTPLLQVSTVGNRELIELLIQNGADPNAVNSVSIVIVLCIYISIHQLLHAFVMLVYA